MKTRYQQNLPALIEFDLSEFLRRNLLRGILYGFLHGKRCLRNRDVRSGSGYAAARTSHALDQAAVLLAGLGQEQHLPALVQAFRMLDIDIHVRIVGVDALI